MRIILFFFSLSFLCLSCKDPLGLKEPIPVHLDKAITAKVALLSNIDQDSGLRYKISFVEIQKILADIHLIQDGINLFDGAQQKAKEADSYFDSLAIRLKENNATFIKLVGVDMKPDLILALKLNEIAFLDIIIQDQLNHETDTIQRSP
jgi:hypothetical protein